jgi:hypothetical protein
MNATTTTKSTPKLSNEMPVVVATTKQCPLRKSPCIVDECAMWIWTSIRSSCGRCGLAGL